MSRNEDDPRKGRQDRTLPVSTPRLSERRSARLRAIAAQATENRLAITIVDPESGQEQEIKDLMGWIKTFIDKSDAISLRDKRLAIFVLQNRTTTELIGTRIFDPDDIRRARRDYRALVEEQLLSPAGVHMVHSYRTEKDPAKGATRYDVAASKGKLPTQRFFNVTYTSDDAIAAYAQREVKVPTDVPEGFVQASKVATGTEIWLLRRLLLLEKYGSFMFVRQSDLQRIREENTLIEEANQEPLPIYESGYDSIKNIALTPARYTKVCRAIRDGKITHVKKGPDGVTIVLAEEVYAYLERPRGRRGKAKQNQPDS